MEEKKTSLLAIYEILKEYSDEDHILSRSMIYNYLINIYNIYLDRRTIYKNIEMLVEYGYDISTYEENKKGYYLRTRDFEKSEVFYLCNAIHSSNYIPLNNSKDLIKKILKSQNTYVQNDFKRQVYIDNYNKKDNKEFFYTIEVLSEAIKEKKIVGFNYTKYNLDKKLVNRREELYYISPYYLVYVNSKTYLVGKSYNHNELIHFRVDKIKSIKIIDDLEYINLNDDLDPYEYAKNKVYMYGGKEVNITLKCHNDILDDIIDLFGKHISLIKYDEDHFTTMIKTGEKGIVYLALQYINKLEILEPLSLRKEMAKVLKKGINKYK